MTTFNELGLAEPVLKAVSAEGYSDPTPIQADAIPALLGGQDVLGIAQTGTGKTASFVLPLLHKIIKKREKSGSKSCGALILSPTRELAAQIVTNIQSYARFSKISVVLVIGGVRYNGQIRQLAKGADIVVATPGRLLDHLESGSVHLSKTHTIVIDEADQMLDLGFLPTVRKIVGKLPATRQTSLFSATMPRQIKKLADDLLTDPVEITVAAVSKPIELINQQVLHVSKEEKRSVLTDILRGEAVKRTVVFTRTKRGADRVCKHLMDEGLSAIVIHGGRSQNQRDAAMRLFRKGQTPILVATDLAARGIDVDDISHVINFDLPEVAENYVHRIGRTARAGKGGTSITLCDASERKLLKDIEKLTGSKLTSDEESLDDLEPRAPRKQKNKRNTAPAPNAPRNKRKRKRTKPQGEGTAKTPANAQPKSHKPKERRGRKRTKAGAPQHKQAA